MSLAKLTQRFEHSLRVCWWTVGVGRFYALPSRAEAFGVWRVHGGLGQR